MTVQNRLGLDMLTLLGMPPVEHKPCLPEPFPAGELPLRDGIAALPSGVGIGIEVPIIADLLAGMAPKDHAARVIAAARALGA